MSFDQVRISQICVREPKLKTLCSLILNIRISGLALGSFYKGVAREMVKGCVLSVGYSEDLAYLESLLY